MATTFARYLRVTWSELSTLKVVFAAISIVLLANLSALVDVFNHPEIPYFDREHLIVGGITALSATVLYLALILHLANMRLSEKRLRSLFDITPDLIQILNTQGVIIQTNHASIAGLGYRKHELVGHGINEFLTPSSQGIFEKEFPLLMELGSCRVEVEFVRKDGNIRVMDCTAVTIEDREGNITSLMVAQRDVTERKQWEKEREKLVLELQAALDKVRTLRGFIPICASCKQIRNDDGYWQQVESYVSEHTLAEFSHSICPDCLKKLYPQYTIDTDA